MLPEVSLVADIGGTNARFALLRNGQLDAVHVLACADYATLEDAMRAYLIAVDAPALLDAAIGIANPVQGDWVRMTNHHWAFSIEQLRQAFDLRRLLVLNDFKAMALSLPLLPHSELHQVGGGAARPDACRALLGAGTGLGVSGLVPDAHGGWSALEGEGGHVSFSPFNEDELRLWRYAHRQFGGHVSAERILSGNGLRLVHAWLCDEAGAAPSTLDAAAISQHALAGSDALCERALDMFCAVLGTVAADLALTLGATGGVYIGGGIVPKLGDAFARSRFRARFEDKGRFDAYLRAIPVYVIHSPWPSLLGAAAALGLRGSQHA